MYNYYSNYNGNYNGNYNSNYSDERIWVQDEIQANSYLVAPNSFVRLWSASQPVFYEKRADAMGRPLPMEVYEYKKRDEVSAPESLDYSSEIKALSERLSVIEKKLSPKKKEDNEDE